MSEVTMYTTPNCGWCKTTKTYFAEHNISYVEKDVAADEDARNEMVQKSGQMGVPVITINDEVVIGFNEPRLAELLSIT